MYRGAKLMKAQVMDRTMGAALLTEGGRMGGRVVGAMAINGRTGRLTVCRAKATVFCMSRPTRLWLFAPGATGISEFRPPQCTGDGHAMAWRVGGRVHHAREVVPGPVVGPAQLPALQHRQQSQHLVRVHDGRCGGPGDPVRGSRRQRAQDRGRALSAGARPEVLHEGRGRARLPVLRVRGPGDHSRRPRP